MTANLGHPPPLPQLISSAQVAKMFGVTTETVRDWIAQGKLTGHQVNGYWRVTYDSAMALANLQHGGTP